MRLTLRLILSLMFGVVSVVTVFTFLQARHDKNLLVDELNRRSLVLSESLAEAIQPILASNNQKELNRLVEKFGNRERLAGVALYDLDGKSVAMTKSLTDTMANPPSQVRRAMEKHASEGVYVNSPRGQEKHLYIATVDFGHLVLVHKAVHIRSRVESVWKEGFITFLIQSLLISLITLVIIRLNILSPIRKAADWIKRLRLGDSTLPPQALPKDIFGPLEKEVSRLAKSFQTARAAAEEEAKLRQMAESTWTAERLKEFARTRLQDKSLVVVSNREPVIHMRKGKDITWMVPASGLVTALEPILRACGGLWVAHGSGDADRDTVDSSDKLRVPPDHPQYTLRRVWLTKEEEDGYYYGFANEGFWPLCHIAHTRPVFKPEDWNYYQKVNRKFAEAILEEIRDITEPLVLIQDYHYALLPRLIKESRPDARVALFWHIPWPNPESFGICPWRREILHGMLGADLMGFHIQFHCNNFLEAVDRYLESRIDWERFTVNRQDHITTVKPFPISVAFTSSSPDATHRDPTPTKDELFKQLNVKARWMGVGVDRIDYTKGILERFRGIERFLELHPQYQGHFTFVELGAPSRTLIPRYHDLMAEVDAEVERINWKFKTKDWVPLVFLKKNHSHQEIDQYYRAADICLVTSLHDGMNLVAKEFLAARDDEDGTLVLSHFAGASRELPDALIINPYDVDQLAESIRFGLEMPMEEKKARIQRMRKVVQANNIYKWGADLIGELEQIRLPNSHPVI